jgi:hypothetical protein
MHLLADLARKGTSSATPTVTGNDVDAWRRRVSLKVEEVQGLIESSKFELSALKLSEIQKLTGEAQIIFILLLSLARQRNDIALPNVVRATEVELNSAIATALLALETYVAGGAQAVVPNLEGAMEAFERSVTDSHLTERLALYRALVAAIRRLSSEPLDAGQRGHEVGALAVQNN